MLIALPGKKQLFGVIPLMSILPLKAFKVSLIPLPTFCIFTPFLNLYFSISLGWPKINFQVYHYDKFGRAEVYGYGFCHIPSSPGTHAVDVVTWRPVGKTKIQISFKYTLSEVKDCNFNSARLFHLFQGLLQNSSASISLVVEHN